MNQWPQWAPVLPVRAVPAWSWVVLGPSTPTFCLATGFMIYQDQTNQGRSWGELKPVLDSFCVTWQMWDAAIRHFVLADEAVSYLGKQGCCFLAGNPLQEQKRFSVVGFCVVLEVLVWGQLHCSKGNFFFCRSFFSCLVLFPCVCLFVFLPHWKMTYSPSPVIWGEAQCNLHWGHAQQIHPFLNQALPGVAWGFSWVAAARAPFKRRMGCREIHSVTKWSQRHVFKQQFTFQLLVSIRLVCHKTVNDVFGPLQVQQLLSPGRYHGYWVVLW